MGLGEETARGHRDGVASCPVIPWTQPPEPAEHRAIPRKARFYGLELLHGASAAASGSCGGTVGLKSPFTWAGAADRRTAALGLGLGGAPRRRGCSWCFKTASDGRRRVVWSRSTTATYPRSRARGISLLFSLIAREDRFKGALQGVWDTFEPFAGLQFLPMALRTPAIADIHCASSVSVLERRWPLRGTPYRRCIGTGLRVAPQC